MDVIEFIKERNRMCETINNCSICPLYKNNECTYEYFDNVKCNHEIVEIFEKWAKEHPRKTRQDKFLEMFPNALLDDYGAFSTLSICPYNVDKTFRCCGDGGRCPECNHDYWMQEVE